MNIELEYLYRDSGNFKNYGSIVLANKNNLAAEKVDRVLVELLGEDRAFIASRLEVPERFFADFPYDPDLDWDMHEYYQASDTNLPVNDVQGRDIGDFLLQVGSMQKSAGYAGG